MSAGAIQRASDRVAAWSPRTKRIVVIAIIGLAFALPFRGLLRNQGPPMEEGFMLVFPERVLHGDFPNKDFLHLYGPGSLWVLAGWMKVFGVTLTSERLFALLQQIGVVGRRLLARACAGAAGSRCAARSCRCSSSSRPSDSPRLAWVGGVALGLLGLGLTLAGRRRLADRPRPRRALAFFGGLVGAGALLFRLDLVVAVALGALAATAGLGAAFKRRYALGLGIGLLAYVVQLATAGPYNTFKGMVLDPVVYLRGGRRLPIPPSWDHLDGFLQRSGAIQPPPVAAPPLLVVAAAVHLVLLHDRGGRRRPRRRWHRRASGRRAGSRRTCSSRRGCSASGMISQGIQRVDSAHFAWVSCVSVALLPVAVFEALRRRTRRDGRLWRRTLCALAIPVGVVLLVPALHRVELRRLRRADVRQAPARVPDHAQRADLLLRTARRRARPRRICSPWSRSYARPGDKLFVGPTDLRKTPYSDAYLYYLLPEYPPGTYYIEMDPGVANADGLAACRRTSRTRQVAILSGVWNDWSEPNDSREGRQHEGHQGPAPRLLPRRLVRSSTE